MQIAFIIIRYMHTTKMIGCTGHQSALMHDHLISPCCIICLKINYALITVTIPNILLQTCGTNQVPNKATTDGQGNYVQCRCAPGYSTTINDCSNVSWTYMLLWLMTVQILVVLDHIEIYMECKIKEQNKMLVTERQHLLSVMY